MIYLIKSAVILYAWIQNGNQIKISMCCLLYKRRKSEFNHEPCTSARTLMRHNRARVRKKIWLFNHSNFVAYIFLFETFDNKDIKMNLSRININYKF